MSAWRSDVCASDLLLAGLSAPLADALRHHARPSSTADRAGGDRPGLLVFDPSGDLRSANDEARAWLDELPIEPGVPTDHGVLPVWLLITVFRAAAVREGAGDGTARTRVRDRKSTRLNSSN